MLGPQEARWVVGYWLAALGHCLLSSRAQRRNSKKKLDILTEKVKLAPRNSKLLISRKQSDNNIIPSPLFPFSLFCLVLGVERKGKGGRKRNPQSKRQVTDRPSIWVAPHGSLQSMRKKEAASRCLLAPTLSHQKAHSFTGIRAYPICISMCTEDQMRHSASRTEELLDSWIFHWQTAIVGPVGPHPVSHFNKSPF